jgi:hypothetical protein
VLTVRAANPRQLLQAVRTADPSGGSAMAVVRTDTAAGPVLAVDAARLAAVAPRLDAYGLPDFVALAAALHPTGFEPVVVRADRLAVEATSTVEGRLVAGLVAADGRPLEVSFGPLTNGRHAYADAVACAAGCRLVSLSVVSTDDITGAVTVHSVSNVDGVLADRTRWRAAVADAAAVPELTAGPDGLRIAPGRGTPVRELTAFVADAPTPLPVVRGGEIAVDRSQPRSAILGSDVLPVRVAAAGARLPGAADGLLADLDYADRLARASGEQSRSTSQVWLGADAPAGIDAALTAAGLTVLGERSIAGRESELDARGPATALRFLVIVALVAIAMALLSFAVAGAAERRPRGAELAALRRQGLPGRVVRRVGLGGYPALGLTAVAIGLVAGGLLVAVVPAPLPAFADAFVAPTPPSVPVLPLAVAALACLLAFATVGLAAGAGLAAAVRRGSAWSD